MPTAVKEAETALQRAVKKSEEEAQLSFFDEVPPAKQSAASKKEKRVLDKLNELDILDMTPLQAMNMLYELQRKLRS